MKKDQVKNKRKTGRIVRNVMVGLLVFLLLSPSSRTWLQQQLMRLGLFRPNLETPKPSENAGQHVVPTASGPLFSDDNGDLLRVSDLKGKVAFINFWATWCGPCKAEMPSIEVLKDRFEGNEGIKFLLVEIEHEQEKAHAFLRDNGLDLPIYYPESQLPADWLTGAIPVTVILDKAGNLAARHEGMADYSRKEVYDFLNELMEK